jgi:hypothetical protein
MCFVLLGGRWRRVLRLRGCRMVGGKSMFCWVVVIFFVNGVWVLGSWGKGSVCTIMLSLCLLGMENVWIY